MSRQCLQGVTARFATSHANINIACQCQHDTRHVHGMTARLGVGLPSMSLLIQRSNNPIGDTNFGAPARRICKEQVGQQGILHFYACCVIALTQIHHNSTRKSQGHHPDIPTPCGQAQKREVIKG